MGFSGSPANEEVMTEISVHFGTGPPGGQGPGPRFACEPPEEEGLPHMKTSQGCEGFWVSPVSGTNPRFSLHSAQIPPRREERQEDLGMSPRTKRSAEEASGGKRN